MKSSFVSFDSIILYRSKTSFVCPFPKGETKEKENKKKKKLKPKSKR
jgi:hypothetical protein